MWEIWRNTTEIPPPSTCEGNEDHEDHEMKTTRLHMEILTAEGDDPIRCLPTEVNSFIRTQELDVVSISTAVTGPMDSGHPYAVVTIVYKQDVD